ncbi:hypothetical protein H0W91_01105 [Patescibacteria group bacterium]|nr:hypothetical protein [Patescibacteria group bacterium]
MKKEKYRSLDPKYKEWILKEYKYWTLLLHSEEQRYLGRSYIWLLREGEMQKFSDTTDEEYTELKLIIQEYEKAIGVLWKPDFMNYAWLANLFIDHGGHGHLHLIPRYEKEREFSGHVFVDTRWGKNYSPADKFDVPVEILEKIRDSIKKNITP